MIGIIGAMDVEIDELKKRIVLPVKTKIAGIDFVCGEIENVTVCAARCNPGKVNAALCAQIMIDRFSVESIILRLPLSALKSSSISRIWFLSFIVISKVISNSAPKSTLLTRFIAKWVVYFLSVSSNAPA